MYRLRPMIPEQMHQVDAAVVLDGAFDPNSYPFRHLGVAAASSTREPLQAMAALLAAVELLTQWGWELVTITEPKSDVLLMLVAVLRRLPPPPPPPPPPPVQLEQPEQ